MTIAGKSITDRELACWRLLAEGLSRKETASALRIPLNSVTTHHRYLYKKIGAHCAADATRLAIRHGVISVQLAS